MWPGRVRHSLLEPDKLRDHHERTVSLDEASRLPCKGRVVVADQHSLPPARWVTGDGGEAVRHARFRQSDLFSSCQDRGASPLSGPGIRRVQRIHPATWPFQLLAQMTIWLSLGGTINNGVNSLQCFLEPCKLDRGENSSAIAQKQPESQC